MLCKQKLLVNLWLFFIKILYIASINMCANTNQGVYGIPYSNYYTPLINKHNYLSVIYQSYDTTQEWRKNASSYNDDTGSILTEQQTICYAILSVKFDTKYGRVKYKYNKRRTILKLLKGVVSVLTFTSYHFQTASISHSNAAKGVQCYFCCVFLFVGASSVVRKVYKYDNRYRYIFFRQ